MGGEVTIAAIETVGSVRVSEESLVEPGKNDILGFKIAPRSA